MEAHWWILAGAVVAGAAVGVLGTLAYIGSAVSKAVGRALGW